MKKVVAVRHVLFEDLGAFAPALEESGFEVRYCDVGGGEIAAIDLDATDLLIVLGGPIGVYEEDTYPFLKDEIALLERRLASGRPLMGLCLGAQLIARAAGARVYPSGTKEIGFAPIRLTEEGAQSCLAAFAGEPMTLHWHGDTFDLPAGADLLASTEVCENQAFSLGANVVGFQFHPEADTRRIERWLVGHAVELAAAGVNVARVRAEARDLQAELKRKARAVMGAWLGEISQ